MCIEDFNIPVNTLCEVTVHEVFDSRCEVCGTQFPRDKFQAVYNGHYEYDNCQWDILQLVEPYNCPGCGHEVGQVDYLCKVLVKEPLSEVFGLDNNPNLD